MRNGEHTKSAAFDGVVRLVDWADMAERRRERMIRGERESRFILSEAFFMLASWSPWRDDFTC